MMSVSLEMPLKDHIKQAVISQIRTQGFAACSFRKLGKLCGVTQTAIYRHFKSKADLIDTVTQEAYQHLIQHIENTIHVDSAHLVQTLDAIAKSYLYYSSENKPYYELHCNISSPSPRCRHLAKKLTDLVTALFSRAIEQQLLPPQDPELLSFSFWTLLRGIEHNVHCVAPLYPPPKNPMAVLQYFYQSLGAA